ncbi:MAG: hypothetical protein ACC707_21030, partial [Thiohalomonadales bacterium]
KARLSPILVKQLVIYFLVIAFQNNRFGFGILTFELILALLGYSLGVLSIRLITGVGRKGSTYLLSNSSLLLWGTIFGVAGFIEMFLVIFQEKIELLFPAVGSLIFGIGIYNLIKRRKLKNDL